MNEKFGADNFTYTYKRDAGRTGNLEIWVDEKQVWSKQESGKFPNKDWDKLFEEVAACMK